MWEVVLNSCTKCRTGLPNHITKPGRADSNQGLHHQIMVWDVFVWCVCSITVVITSVLWQPIGPIFKGQEIQQWKKRTEFKWKSLPVWGVGALSVISFFEEARHFGCWLSFRFQAQKYLTGCTLRWAILNHCKSQTQWLVKISPENKSSSWVVTGIWLLEN
jgi:hypothetical protein